MISFQNNGLIDVTAVTTFGVSAKESKNPVGFFGTGLKYAIGITLRLGGAIEIWRGADQCYKFTAASKIVRGQSFDVIYMNDQPLGFTTDVGRNWEGWQAFRELYCNAMDEEGGVVALGELGPLPDKTTIHVHCPEIENAYNRLDEIVIQDQPLHKIRGVDVHRGPSRHLYYRGIKAYELDAPATFRYNITESMQLTEDRTLGNPHFAIRQIMKHIAACDDARLIKRVITAERKTLEQMLPFFNVTHCLSDTFIKVIEEMPFKQITNHAAVEAYKKRSGREYEPDVTPLNDVERIQLDRAAEFVKDVLGYNINLDDVYVTSDLSEHNLAIAYEGKTFIARRCFMMGTKVVAHALLEEYLHNQYRLMDESRELQNHLFDLVITLGERVRGEPL